MPLQQVYEGRSIERKSSQVWLRDEEDVDSFIYN